MDLSAGKYGFLTVARILLNSFQGHHKHPLYLPDV